MNFDSTCFVQMKIADLKNSTAQSTNSLAPSIAPPSNLPSTTQDSPTPSPPFKAFFKDASNGELVHDVLLNVSQNANVPFTVTPPSSPLPTHFHLRHSYRPSDIQCPKQRHMRRVYRLHSAIYCSECSPRCPHHHHLSSLLRSDAGSATTVVACKE